MLSDRDIMIVHEQQQRRLQEAEKDRLVKEVETTSKTTRRSIWSFFQKQTEDDGAR